MQSSDEKNSVLIVDDERANILALINILSSTYTVYASSDGRDALEIAETSLPDVILLDVLMPDMDGYEVITALKRSEKTRDIPVIFITGLDSSDAEEKGLALGAADYIPKPFHSAIVRLRIENQIKIVNHTQALSERLQQQALMTKISRCFLTDAHVDALYTDTLRVVGEFMGLAQVLLYKLEDDNNALVCQNEWKKSELGLATRVGEKLQLDAPLISFMHNLLENRESDACLYSNDPRFNELALPFRQYFHNYIVTPIFVKGKARAILGFSKEEGGQAWSESETNLATLVSGIFSGVFERDAMERQFSLVERSPNLDLYISADGAVEYVNPAAVAVTGYPKSELIAGGLGLIIDAKTLADIQNKRIPEAMRDDAVLFETEISRKDGEKRILIASIFQTGKNNFGMTTSDITTIRALETDLAAAKERAEYLSRAKSEFLARMSHELRTPMNAIMGMAQIIKMRGIPDTIAGHFEKIDTASRHLLQMIDDVLDLSGMEYGMFKLSEAAFDLNEVFKEVLQKAEYNASAKGQTLTANLAPAMPTPLVGDAKRLKQVIDNILANAIKFTPEQGEISIGAGVADEDAQTLTLWIEIADNGIGISQEQQKQLFVLFEQVDGGNTRKYGGIGIGLPLSKLIVEMMGGAIGVESELGQGARFMVTCKLKKIT